MNIDTSSLGLSPNFGHTVVDVGLVDYLGYVMRHVVDEGGIGRGDFCTVDCICRTIFDQKSEKCIDTVDEEDNDDTGNGEKDGETAPHDWRERGMS